MCTLLRRGGLLPPHGGGFHFREFFIMIRHVFLIGALLFAMTPANDATAQVVAVALDLDFNDPADVNSGGNFTVVASTFGGGTQGISNLNLVNISDANFGSAVQYFSNRSIQRYWKHTFASNRLRLSSVGNGFGGFGNKENSIGTIGF